MAASKGNAEALQALADTGDEAVLASLAAPHPDDGRTPEARARQAYVAAAAREDSDAMRRYLSAADAVRDGMAIPADEPRVMQSACDDLESLPADVTGGLPADLYCPVSFEPFTTAGPGRPVHLTVKGEFHPQQCVSARSMHGLMDKSGSINPETREKFNDFVEAEDRQALVRDVTDAYRQNPNDVEAARRGALNAHAAHEMKMSKAVARPALALGEAAQWGAIMSAEAQVRIGQGNSFEAVTASAATGLGSSSAAGGRSH